MISLLTVCKWYLFEYLRSGDGWRGRTLSLTTSWERSTIFLSLTFLCGGPSFYSMAPARLYIYPRLADCPIPTSWWRFTGVWISWINDECGQYRPLVTPEMEPVEHARPAGHLNYRSLTRGSVREGGVTCWTVPTTLNSTQARITRTEREPQLPITTAAPALPICRYFHRLEYFILSLSQY